MPRAEPLRGRVLDARTRLGIVDFELVVSNGTLVDRVRTDSSGAFVGTVAVPHGRVTLTPVDAESVAAAPEQGGLVLPRCAEPARALDWTGGEVELVVAIGPVFELAFAPDAPEGAPAESAISTVLLEATAPGSVDAGVTLRAAVRAGEGARRWVRFPALPRGTFGAPFGARLVVVHGDGLWRAEADVTSLLDAHGGTVTLAWRPAARWIGQLRAPDGRPAAGAWVVLTRTSDLGVTLERRRARTNDRGRYDFLGLEPGRWQLSGEPLRYERFQSQVRTLAALEPAQLNLMLDSVRETTALLVHVLGGEAREGGSPPPAPELVLRRSGETLPLETLRVTWSVEDGRYACRTSFPGLPSGAYQVQLLPAEGDEDAWPERVRAGPASATPLVFPRAPAATPK